MTITTAVFDLDGTLVDSDRALIEPFLRLGIAREDIALGPLLVDQCELLGVDMDEYLALYDPSAVVVYPGVDELLRALPRYGIASHKLRASGEAELARFGWTPAVAMFAEDFEGGHKALRPVLDALGVDAHEVVFVGDTEHDRACAREAGATFALAGWNPRAASEPGDVVLARPADLLDLGVGLLAG